MAVTLDTSSQFFPSTVNIKTATPYQRVGDKDALQGLQDDKEERKGQSGGFGLPGQLTREEQQRIDTLKNQAMQIASQAESGELNGSQRAQIKSIEQEIGKISRLPMRENLTETAVQAAREKKAEKQQEAAKEQVQPEEQGFDMQNAGTDPTLAETMGRQGQRMLSQQSLATAIKTLGRQGAAGIGA